MRSRLYLRLLSVALLVLFLPVAGIWSLASFEKELLATEEQMMAVEARSLAAWLGGPGEEAPSAERARAALRALERPLAGRIRVLAADGTTLADTAGGAEPARPASKISSLSPRDSPLYRIGALLWSLSRAFFPEPPKSAGAAGDEPAIAAALAGAYGATTRLSADGTDTVLTVAVPLHAAAGAAQGAAVTGAVVVSRTTDTVLAALDRIRIDLFRVVLLSLVATALIALLLARGLVAPLLRLRDAADRALRSPGVDAPPIPEVERRDEIGEVARALAGLHERLGRRVGELEAVASDLAHELRNPLAAMRSAADLLAESTDDGERRRLAELIRSEAMRVDRVVTSLQELARLDAQRVSAGDRPADLVEVVQRVVAGTVRPEAFDLALPDAARVSLPPEAAERIVENLVENALSFSPPGGRVRIVLAPRDGNAVELTVADQGPGVPPEHRERIFDRFFSWRPEGAAGHLGLGLAIARALLERHGGAIALDPPAPGEAGARFRLRFPAA